MAQPTYDGFISYSRQDTAVALRLQKRLESVQAPPGAPRASVRLFLDAQERPAPGNSNDSRRQALETSTFLVVIASPRSAESELVRRDVRTWVESKGWDRVLFVLAAGEPTLVQAFSDPENDTVYDAPVAADLRAPSSRQTLRLIDDAALRIAARVMGVELDALRLGTLREGLAWQRQLIALLSGGLAVMTIALGIATWQWRLAVAEQPTAERRLKAALPVDAVDPARSLQAQMLEHLRQGTLASEALDAAVAERELSAAERSVQQIPVDRRPRAATLVSRARCELAWSLQAYADALSCLETAARLARSWGESGSPESRFQLAEILRLRGDARAHLRDWKAANADYREAEALIEQLRSAGPDTAELILAAAAVQQRLSRFEEVARSTEGVTDRLVKSTQLIARVVQQELSVQGLLQMIEIYQRLAESCARLQRLDQAQSFNAQAYDLAAGLYASSPQNARYQLALAAAKHARGKEALVAGRLLRATVDFAEESDLLHLLLEKHRTSTQAFRDYFGAQSMLIEVLTAQKNLLEATEEFAKLETSVRNFVNAETKTPTDETLAVAIRGLSQVADAARRVNRPNARIEASEKSLQLAQQRYTKSPELGDARMDLFIAHANMILAAGVTNDTPAMEAHAREARRLIPLEGEVEPDEQVLVAGIQKLIAQVLGPVGDAH